MRPSFVNCVFLVLSIISQAQELEFNTKLSIDAKTDFIDLDQFGNIYLVLDDELRKLDANGKFLSSYSDPVQGSISQVDLLNPMNPLIYYQSSNLLRLLDNRLNQSREYNLSFQFQDPKNLAASNGNRIWLYDQNADRMLLYDLDQEKVLNRSPLLSKLINELKPVVLNSQSGFDQVVVLLQLNEKQKFLIFDAQGAFEKAIELPFELKSWDYYNGQIIVLYGNNSLQVHKIDGAKSDLIICPLAEAEEIFYHAPTVYLRTKNQLHQYRWIDSR